MVRSGRGKGDAVRRDTVRRHVKLEGTWSGGLGRAAGGEGNGFVSKSVVTW